MHIPQNPAIPLETGTKMFTAALEETKEEIGIWQRYSASTDINDQRLDERS